MTSRSALDVEMPESGFERARASDVVHRSGLLDFFEAHAPGEFGPTALSVATFEALARASDVGFLAAERLRGQIRDDLADHESYRMPVLEPEHLQLISSFQIVVSIDVLKRQINELCGLPDVDGTLELEGLQDLLIADQSDADRMTRILKLTRVFAQNRLRKVESDVADDQRCVDACVAFFELLRRAILFLAENTSGRAVLGVLRGREVRVTGFDYDGLQVREVSSDRTGLLPVTVDKIVGNQDFLEAGMRLARDVAGFDLESHSNPKTINPVLFGLGRPGSGKTVTAHAIGHYFLDYCRERGVPARFLIVRRTDWASSYQNASANNLVKLFREDVYGFEGVCGVYWADIDTAFASRDSSQLRSEEKNNLAAVFGIFDGTLLPRDGKWFMLCDANTLHMDEATVSRIAQNPYAVDGPTTPEHFVELMRDVLLKDLADFIECEPEGWRRLAELAVEADLSGRNIDAICRNVRSEIQDFEYPEEYFAAGPEERQKLVKTLGNQIDEARLAELLNDYVAFTRDAEKKAGEQRFQREVDAIVMRLNATRAAAEKSESLG